MITSNDNNDGDNNADDDVDESNFIFASEYIKYIL